MLLNDAAKAASNAMQRELYVSTGQNQEQLQVLQRRGPVGSILDRPTYQDPQLELGLALRPFSRSSFFSEYEVKAMNAERTADGVVFTWQGKEGTHVWTTKPELGYAVTAFRAGGIHVTASDFDRVGNLMLPKTIVFQLRVSETDGTSHLTQATRMTVHEYSLNDPQNTDARYHIAWPKGITVRDYRSGARLIADESGVLRDRK